MSAEESSGNTGSNNGTDELMAGIDIGTQNTAAVIDEDDRSVKKFSSIIGFPKNDLSRQKLEDVLGRPVAFDDEVYDNIIMQNIDLHWPLKTFDSDYSGDGENDEEFSEKDKETLNLVVKRVLDTDEIKNNSSGKQRYIRLAIATPSTTALEYNKELIDFARRNLPEDARPAFLVESESHFAGYRLTQLDNDLARKGVIVVDIGAGTLDFHVYDGNPSNRSNTLSLSGAGNAVTDRLFELLEEQEYQNTWQEVNTIKEEYGYVASPSEREAGRETEIVVDELRYQGRENVRADIGPEIQKAFRPLLDDMVEGYKSLMNKYNGPLPETVGLVGLQGQTEGLKEAYQEALRDEQYSVTVRNLSDFDVDEPTTFVAEGALDRIESTPLKELVQ